LIQVVLFLKQRGSYQGNCFKEHASVYLIPILA